MWENVENGVDFHETYSAADLSQIKLDQRRSSSSSSWILESDNSFPRKKSSQTPLFTTSRFANRLRPLPELQYDDYGSKSEASKYGYFLDGRKKVDFVLAYKEPHDDYLITAMPEKEIACQRQFYLEQLQKADLEIELDRHHEHNGDVLVFVKIHVPWATLCREAERMKLRMPLILEDDPYDDYEEKIDWLNFLKRSSKFVNRREIDNADDPPAFGGKRMTWIFNRQHMRMFKIDHPDTFFTCTQRIEIAWNVLQQCRNDSKHDRRHGIEPLLERGIFNAAFPLHDGPYGSMHPYTHGSKSDLSSRQRLHVEWAGWSSTCKRQPLNRIRNYFGEKFGFYFAFMDFYTKMLIFPSAFGLLAFVYGLIATETTYKEAVEQVCDPSEGQTGSFFMCPICNPPNCAPFFLSHDCSLNAWQFRLDNEATLIVSCATLVWCALFVKFWKRREAQLAVDWDTFETKEEATEHRSQLSIRASYEEQAAATKRSNPVTMEPESYVPRHKRVIRVAASIAVATLLLLAAGGSLMGLIVSRIALYGAYRKLGEPLKTGNVEWARWTVHGLIFLMVVIFEWIYDNLADRLTELECPKTTEDFLSSLLWKMFIFEELVDFLPIAYAAWFRGKNIIPKDLTFDSEICEPNGCMSEVVELVAVLLLARLVIGNIAEIGWPALKRFANSTFRKFLGRWKNKNPEENNFHGPQWLKDYYLLELKLDGVAEEYMEMMIQFSFVAFFVPAFPLIPLVCFLNNIAEIRVDGINFLASHRRPVPARAPGLQIWNKFMEIILIVAVLCNAALISFTSEIVPRLYFKYGMTASNATLQGYKAFTMSQMLIPDWPELADYLKEHPMPDLYAHLSIDDNFDRDHEQSLNGESEIFNDTHKYCYYLDFRHKNAPYGHTTTWWKIFCLRVAAFTIFIVVFYIFMFLCDFAISDVPDEVTRRLKRREYLVQSKLLTRQQNERSTKFGLKQKARSLD